MKINKSYDDFIDFTLERYNNKLNKFNLSPKSLGWDKKINQIERFDFSSRYLNLNNSSILDVGCGFADFLDFLEKKKIPFNNYVGYDINENFIEICKRKYPKYIFKKKDMFNLGKKKYDFIFAFGIFSLRHKGISNIKLMENFSKYAFPRIKKALVINYISKYQEKKRTENFVQTYCAKNLFNFFYNNISKKIFVIRSEKRIPFYEETLVVYR